MSKTDCVLTLGNHDVRLGAYRSTAHSFLGTCFALRVYPDLTLTGYITSSRCSSYRRTGYVEENYDTDWSDLRNTIMSICSCYDKHGTGFGIKCDKRNMAGAIMSLRCRHKRERSRPDRRYSVLGRLRRR